MALVIDFVLSFVLFDFTASFLSKKTNIGKAGEEIDIDIKQHLPTGIVQIQPVIIYSPTVEWNFDRLEIARKRYTAKSEDHISMYKHRAYRRCSSALF